MLIYECGYSLEVEQCGYNRQVKDYVVAPQVYSENTLQQQFQLMLQFLQGNKNLKLNNIDADGLTCRDADNNSYTLAHTTTYKDGKFVHTTANIVNHVLGQPFYNDRVYRDPTTKQIVDIGENAVKFIKNQQLTVANEQLFNDLYIHQPEFLFKTLTRMFSLRYSSCGALGHALDTFELSYKITQLPEYFINVVERNNGRLKDYLDGYHALHKIFKDNKIRYGLTIG